MLRTKRKFQLGILPLVCYDEGVSSVFLEASYVPGTLDVLPCNSYLKRKGGELGGEENLAWSRESQNYLI